MPAQKIIKVPKRDASLVTEKRKKTIADNGEPPSDRISTLADDILVSILASLTMKEAGRTSVLSKRWKYLWTSYPNLNFDASTVLYELRYEIYKKKKRSLAAERTIYLNWVNQVVGSHKGPTIDQFMIQFGLDQRQSKNINAWVEFAFKMNVRNLTLDLDKYSRSIADDERYCFPDISAQLHKHMSCNLTSLRLIQVNVTGEVLGYLLANCPLLDCLVVHQSSSLSNLEVSHASLKLKTLELRLCFEMKKVTIAAPNLASFIYHGPRITMELNDVPKLVKLSLGLDCSDHFTSKPLEFYSYISQLEVLVLETACFEEDAITTEFPQFANLKHLEVSLFADDKSLLAYTPLIKACPSLCKFSLKLNSCFSNPYAERSKLASCPHYNLKVVEVVGFAGHVSDVEFVSYLMKNAVMLEEVIIDTRVPANIGSPWEFEKTKERAHAKSQAKRLLEKLGPGVTSVVI